MGIARGLVLQSAIGARGGDAVSGHVHALQSLPPQEITARSGLHLPGTKVYDSLLQCAYCVVAASDEMA